MSAGRAAGKIRRGLQRNRAVIAFPFLLALATRFGSLMPDLLRRRILSRFRFSVTELD